MISYRGRCHMFIYVSDYAIYLNDVLLHLRFRHFHDNSLPFVSLYKFASYIYLIFFKEQF